MNDQADVAELKVLGAAACVVRGDTFGLLVMSADLAVRIPLEVVVAAAARAAAEQLRACALSQGTPAQEIVESLMRAHAGGRQREVSLADAVLNVTAAHLAGAPTSWSAPELCAMCPSSQVWVDACVHVLAAALTLRACDLGMLPADLAAEACMDLSRRSAGLAPRLLC